jgi:hypothetical protein
MSPPSLSTLWGTKWWKTGNCCTDRRKAFDHVCHPREGVDDHQIDKAPAQHVFDRTAYKIGRVHLTLGGILDPGHKDLDQKKREEELKRIWLNCCAVFKTSTVKLISYSIEFRHKFCLQSVDLSAIVAVVGPESHVRYRACLALAFWKKIRHADLQLFGAGRGSSRRKGADTDDRKSKNQRILSFNVPHDEMPSENLLEVY